VLSAGKKVSPKPEKNWAGEVVGGFLGSTFDIERKSMELARGMERLVPWISRVPKVKTKI
jgi:hypothetical protein